MPNCSNSARILWIAACGFSVFSAVRCQADPKRSPHITIPKQALSSSTTQTDSKIVSMMPDEFEHWLIANTASLTQPNLRPLVANQAVFQRLKKGLYVTDKSYKLLISAWRQAEGDFPGQTHLAESFRVVDSLMKYTYDRPTLLADLHTQKAGLYIDLQNNLSAGKELETAAELLRQEEDSVDHQHLQTLVLAGQEYLFIGDKKSALPLFETAWYTMQLIRHGIKPDGNLEEQAGLGLLDCNRDNIPALKQITTYNPDVYLDLKPIIAGAIKDAQERYADPSAPKK